MVAKTCNKCGTQVVWDDKIVPEVGNNRFKEVETGLPHGPRCYMIQQGKLAREHGEDVKPYQQQLQKPANAETGTINSINAKLDALIQLMKGSVIKDKDYEIAELKQKVTELEAVIKKEGMGLKTADGQRIRKPETSEELDLTE